MPTWLLILIVGVVLIIVGFAWVGEVLLYIGIAVLVLSLIMALMRRGGARV